MKTGLRASFSTLPQTELIGGLTEKKSKIPIYASDFKREYLFIRGLNIYFKCFSKKLDYLIHGLFKLNISNKIKKYMKRFLREQEKGNFTNMNKLKIPSYDIDIIRDILFINEQFEIYKRSCICYDSDESDDTDDENGGYGGYDDYDDWGASLVDSKLSSGFKEFHNIFKKIFDQLNYNRYDCESDSESEIDRKELDFPYTESDFEDFFDILKSSFESD